MSIHTTESTQNQGIVFKGDAALIRLNPQRSLQLLTTQSLLFMKKKKNNDILKTLFFHG